MQELRKDRTHQSGAAQRQTSQDAPQNLTHSPNPSLLQRLHDLPPSLAAAEIQSLQRSVGNRAVQQLISTQRTAQPTVQRIGTGELLGRGMAMEELAADAPEKGVNLWVATNPNIPATIYLLGTAHGLRLSEVGADAAARAYLIDFLRTEEFTHVFTEVAAELPYTQHVPELAKWIEEKHKAVETLKRYPEGGPPATDKQQYIAYRRAMNAVSAAESNLAGNDMTLDDAYLNLARKPRAGKEVGAKVGALEDVPRRALARETNIRDMGLESHDPGNKLRRGPNEVIPGNEDVISGDQKSLFMEAASEAKSGRDIANAEQRNKQWMKHVSPYHVLPNDKQLWIIGAAHLAGLVLRFKDINWTVTHQAPPPAKQEGEEKID